ncbi:MAG: flavodoxin domain-containing protein [Bellilinea sp.]
MNRILVTYATMAGSTADVALAVGNEITKSGLQVDVLPLDQVKDIEGYGGVVVGAPMIMGYHRAALRFLRKYRSTLQRIPLAVFVTAMSVTSTGEKSAGDVPVYLDDKLSKAPENIANLTFRERYARLSNYLQPILRAVQPVKPVSVGVFGGRLEYGRLKWWAVLFVMLFIQAPARDLRDWAAIQAWSAGLPAAFELAEKKAAQRP